MIYLDYAATTKPSQTTIDTMNEVMETYWGNPSSLHHLGIQARKKYNELKKTAAQLLGADRKQITFTGSATESINTVIKSTFAKHPKETIVTSTIEHSAVLKACEHIQSQGAHVIEIPVDEAGFIDIDTFEQVCQTHDVSLASFIFINNEMGTMQNINDIKAITDQYNVKCHLDMVQGPAHMPINLQTLDIDYATFAAHKFYGPRGIGILYQKDSHLEGLIHGGKQENGKRAGTENLAGIAGTVHALEACQKNLQHNEKTINALAEFFIQELKNAGLNIRLNGAPLHQHRLNSILNIGFKDQDAHLLSFKLNEQGIYLSTGSACHSDVIEPSHVLKAMNCPEAYLHGSMRFSIAHTTTQSDLSTVIKALTALIESGDCLKS